MGRHRRRRRRLRVGAGPLPRRRVGDGRLKRAPRVLFVPREIGISAIIRQVYSGQSYVHSFETAGEHAYYCVPHEAAGMTGTIVVEE
ncbi:plastocyanin/azurin family copper-binding protein [Haloferax sp. AB510]|uniref:plastocyanin/azurin family copper-binding protein n=1 Tax=Haloferax sp. AB510 TaxID=2934172 RepID=UPI00209BC03C|nr:plastocyanin/azurin family copper-binding protein [Haloferax sp. AB510]MCO8267256.1 plastocyanin/azurin family copper-binding protein [Haloferax sp. AB510]